MQNFCLEYPEVAGKTIEYIRYIYDPSGAPEVDIRFNDGVSLSIKLRVALRSDSELYKTCDGDVQTLQRYPEV